MPPLQPLVAMIPKHENIFPKEFFLSMEAVGVESGGKELIVNNINHLGKYFSRRFSFLRILRVHFCPLALETKRRMALLVRLRLDPFESGVLFPEALTSRCRRES